MAESKVGGSESDSGPLMLVCDICGGRVRASLINPGYPCGHDWKCKGRYRVPPTPRFTLCWPHPRPRGPMSETRDYGELVERLREKAGYEIERGWDGDATDLDEAAQAIVTLHEGGILLRERLAALQERAEAAERERDAANERVAEHCRWINTEGRDWERRAVAAEQRIAELDEALREIAEFSPPDGQPEAHALAAVQRLARELVSGAYTLRPDPRAVASGQMLGLADALDSGIDPAWVSRRLREHAVAPDSPETPQ